MNKRVVVFLFLILTSVFLIGFLSATLSLGNQSYSIEKKYGVSQNITGWINVSMSNENANSSFEDSFNNKISLLNLLKLNSGSIYSCTPLDCESDYSVANGATEKSLTDVLGTKIYGMLFSGNILDVDLVAFNISATGIPPSCSNQVEVDFFNDGITDFANTRADASICEGTKSYGCFNTTNTDFGLATIESQPYCERISLSKAPGFRLGAWIKNNTGTKNITIGIYDKEGDTVDSANCFLQGVGARGSDGSEASCDVNYPIQNPGDYYVCLSSTGTGYVTRSTNANQCGFWHAPPSNEIQAYQIFAEAKKFGGFNLINITNSLSTGEDLSYLTKDYILSKYGSLNCAKGCTVPIKFKTNISAEAFTLNINNVDIKYSQEGASVPETRLYDTRETPAVINLDYGKLYLDNSGLKVRNTTGDFLYKLKFGSQTVFSATLSVQNAPIIKSIAPTKTAYAFPTQFQLSVDFPRNVSRYEWNFGDNTSNAVTTTNKIVHTYNNSGIYNLNVIIKDTNNISSSRTFPIIVSSPGNLINSTLSQMRKDITNVKNQISSYDFFYQTRLNEVINISNLSSILNVLEAKYTNTNESDYNLIVSEMLALNIPESVVISKATANNYVFFPKRDNINVDVLKSIEPGDYNNSDSVYIEAISGWNAEKITSTLGFKEISARYEDGGSVPVLRVFDFKMQEKSPLNYSSYFIIKDMQGLTFKDNYGQQDTDGYNKILFTGGIKEIVCSTTENVSFDNVPAFMAPGLSRLSIVEPGIPTETETPFNWKMFGIAIIALLVVGFIVYIILQGWYKRKYEGHLFKNKNDLYNLFHFIEVQRGKGIAEGDIHEKLKKAGWDGEQIKYSMKKYSGKRTGMLEIPIDKLFSVFEKKK